MEKLACLDLKWCQAAFYNAADSEKMTDVIKMNQVHSADCLYLDSVPKESPSVDALITDKKGLKLAVKTADCAPILMADTKRPLVAAVHAGWKGAFQGILENTVLEMLRHGANIDTLYAGIGPHIQKKTFEMGEEIKALFPKTEDGFFTTLGNKILFNFDAYVIHRLKRAGVRFIETVGDDTYPDPIYFSYRRDPQNPGRQFSSIIIKGGKK